MFLMILRIGLFFSIFVVFYHVVLLLNLRSIRYDRILFLTILVFCFLSHIIESVDFYLFQVFHLFLFILSSNFIYYLFLFINTKIMLAIKRYFG